MSVYRFVDQGLMNPSWQGLQHEWIENGGVIVTVDFLKESDNSHLAKQFTFESMWEEPWYKQQEVIINRVIDFAREGE